jgi:hypothetical protein
VSLTHHGTGTPVEIGSSASNPITRNPGWPAGYTPTAGDLAVVTVVTREAGEASPTIDWTVDDTQSLSGGGGTFGAGTGPVRLTWFIKRLAGGESTPVVSLAGTATSRVLMACVTIAKRTAGDDYGVVAAFGAETTAGTSWSQATSTNPGLDDGDLLLVGYAVRDDQHAGFSAMGVTATGATIGSVTERADLVTAGGNDAGIALGSADVTAGPASAAPVVTGTIGSSETGVVGVLRIREVTPRNTAPTLVDSDEVADWTSFATPRSTGSVSWQTGDVVVVHGLVADDVTTLNTPTVSGLTFSLVAQTGGGGSTCRSYVWAATAGSNGSGAIQGSKSGSDVDWGIAVEVWRDSDGVGNSAVDTSTAKTVSLPRSDAHSAVSYGGADWSADVDAATFTPSGATVIESAGDGATYGVHVGWWSDQGDAGTTSYGVSITSTGSFAKVAVEILGTGSAGPAGFTGWGIPL